MLTNPKICKVSRSVAPIDRIAWPKPLARVLASLLKAIAYGSVGVGGVVAST